MTHTRDTHLQIPFICRKPTKTRDRRRMETQMDQPTFHPPLQLPCRQPHPTEHETHDQIHQIRPTYVQPNTTVPHRTRSHRRILPPIRTKRKTEMSLLRHSTDETSYTIRMQNPPPTPTLTRHRKSMQHRISSWLDERNQETCEIPEGLMSVRQTEHRPII